MFQANFQFTTVTLIFLQITWLKDPILYGVLYLFCSQYFEKSWNTEYCMVTAAYISGCLHDHSELYGCHKCLFLLPWQNNIQWCNNDYLNLYNFIYCFSLPARYMSKWFEPLILNMYCTIEKPWECNAAYNHAKFMVASKRRLQ